MTLCSSPSTALVIKFSNIILLATEESAVYSFVYDLQVYLHRQTPQVDERQPCQDVPPTKRWGNKSSFSIFPLGEPLS